MFAEDSLLGSVLAHPLPAGMRDLLPEESRALTRLGRRLSRSFELAGYERVTVPVFEYAAVLERGLGALDPREVLRFVEPESGEVVALRPDMTPQIARLVATRLADAPLPARLAYEGSVVRLRRERARRHRQIPQVGIELIGSGAPDGDAEVLTVATDAMKQAGLEDFVLDLGHARIAGALLDLVRVDERAPLVEALASKDQRELERRVAKVGLDLDLRRVLVQLLDLCGGAEVWPLGEKLLRRTPAEAAFRELLAAFRFAEERGLAPRLSVDLAEVRDLGYYTGVTFQILAFGPGAAIGSGGRYDRLLEQFGAPRPAAGFAVALDHMLWALADRGDAPSFRLLVSGARGPELVPLLRARGVTAVLAPADAWAHARAWRFSHVVEVGSEGASLVAVTGTERRELPGLEGAALAQEIADLSSFSPDAEGR